MFTNVASPGTEAGQTDRIDRIWANIKSIISCNVYI